LLEALGSVGAAALTLNALGLLPVPTALAAAPVLPAESGRGKSVAVLGAGIAGLVSTLLLRRAGYRCTVLEARIRPGGRVWTVRGGDTIEETDSIQKVDWDSDPDLYFNAGAARLSHHHLGVLGYCRELDVALEPFINDNRAGLIQIDSEFSGEPQRIARLQADLRGAVAELAARSAPLDGSLNALLRNFGALTSEMAYAGSARAGFVSPETFPGAGTQRGTRQKPIPIGDIARVNEAFILATALTFSESWNQAPAMLQPVGGMDRIVYALEKAIGGDIAYGHEVEQILRTGERAQIVSRDRRSGATVTTDADYVVCTIPLPVLKSIRADFSPAVQRAIEEGAATYAPTAKVAFAASPRWWEMEDRLYGGISWTSRDINQLWYPSHGFHARKGILIGAYIWDYEAARRYGTMTPAERRTAAVADGERLHPGYGTKVGAAASVVWSKMPYSLGGWAEWDSTPGARQTIYPVLLPPDGPFHFAGEHMSYVTGWQEGAVQSAHYTVGQIAERVRAGR
jgi:monoamine oxidase